MHLVLKTLLNHVERLKGFVYESSRLIEGRVPRIEIQLRARERSRGACSHCQKPAPGYDRLAERQFQFVPLCPGGHPKSPACGHLKLPHP